MVQDLILNRFKVEYHPHYICNLLDQLGFSFQKARFVSDHLDEAARSRWLTETWPEILRLARQTQALILFGDEASFAQWGSLSYTWAPKGQQPTVKTSGRRKGYKVFGLIEFFSGRLFWKGQTDRFNAASYSAFLAQVLAETHEPLILIQDGARYHTGQATRDFLAAHADRLTKFQLPSYSPDFNPIEHLWRNVKKDATHLKYFPTFDALTEKVDKTMQQIDQAAQPHSGADGPLLRIARGCSSLTSLTPNLYRNNYSQRLCRHAGRRPGPPNGRLAPVAPRRTLGRPGTAAVNLSRAHHDRRRPLDRPPGSLQARLVHHDMLQSQPP